LETKIRCEKDRDVHSEQQGVYEVEEEEKLETCLGLRVNREKTNIVWMGKKGVRLDFLGFTLRYDRDLKGRNRQYLNVVPSKKAVARLRDKIQDKTRKRI